MFPQGLGDTPTPSYPDPGRGLPGRSGALLKQTLYQLALGLGSHSCRLEPLALGGPY